MATAESLDGIEARIINWVRQNRRLATIAAGVLILLAGGIWFWRSAAERRENFAERALQSARSAAETGNLPQAASDLSRLASNYSGTRAADEGALLLAQIRLLDNKPAIAAADLQAFINRGPRREFLAPAYSLLGAALEENGQFREAAQAYESAARATPYEPVRDQHLLDAGRSWMTAGDTASAVRTYERILASETEGPAAIEARIRVSELKKG